MRKYEITFSVPFVHGWQRAGTRSGMHYKPKRTRSDERQIAIAYQGASLRKYGRVVAAPRYVPVSVKVDAYAPAPKRWPNQLPAWLKPRVPFVKKPDVDNVLKLFDGLNGVAWYDDAQVTDVRAIKHDRTPTTDERTEYVISWEQEDE